MKITISVLGRFHAFYLANELQKHGYLHRLITSYPKFETVKYDIPGDKIISLPLLEVINRIRGRMAPFSRSSYFANLIAELYDRSAAKHIPSDTDVFIGWSGRSLHGIRYARGNGAITIMERGASHIMYQTNILKEEYGKYGLGCQLPHPNGIAKEIREYEEADYISIPSHFAKRTFLEQGIPKEKLIHVPYGVDLADFRPVPKEDEPFRIIHCGAITLQKGVHYLLQAFYELNLPDAELWVIGGMSNEIKSFLEKYDNGRVFHKESYPQNELYQYYSQGSVFCLMSIQEGFGMVIPQAMACGLPVICTTNTAGEDIVRDGVDGFIIPIRDVEALKEKILFMYKNPERCREMGASAHLRVQSEFSWEDYGHKMVNEYERIMCNKHGRGQNK